LVILIKVTWSPAETGFPMRFNPEGSGSTLRSDKLRGMRPLCSSKRPTLIL